MRYLLLSFLSLAISSTAFTQAYCPSPYGNKNDRDNKKVHVSAGFGLTKIYGDIKDPGSLGNAFVLKGDYQVFRGILVGLEGQFGRLEAVSSVNDPRQFKNKYRSLGAVFTVHPFKALDNGAFTSSYTTFLYQLKNALYIGIGAAAVSNNYDEIYRDESIPSTYGPMRVDEVSGAIEFENSSSSTILPSLNLGLAFPIATTNFMRKGYWSVLLNVQFNMSNNDLLDGYVPHRSVGDPIQGNNDVYNFHYLGLRYSF